MRLPASKSLAQRYLSCAALCSEPTRLRGLGDAEDTRALLAALRSLGADIADGDGGPSPRDPLHGEVRVVGRAPGPERGLRRPERTGSSNGSEGDGAVSAGESGTAARLLTAALALCARPGFPIRLAVEGSLTTRRSEPLVACLRAAGARLRPLERDDDSPRPAGATWPLEIEPVGPPSVLRLEHAVSSQELSALLIACGAWPGEFTVEVRGRVPSLPYVRMTVAVLGDFGVDVTVDGDPGRGRLDTGSTPVDEDLHEWRVRGPLRPPSGVIAVEPDASAAAVALAAACLSGGDLCIPELTDASPQGDVRNAEHLAAFGCDARLSERGLVARGAPVRGAHLDLSGEPDLAPVLAAVAAAAALASGEGSRLEGLGTLPGKESSRIEVLAAGLASLGFAARAGDDVLEIGLPDAEGPRDGAPDPFGPRTLDPHGDHRMAFAFALLGLVVPGVAVAGPGCVAKSWPGFWDSMAAAGLKTLHPGRSLG